MRADELYKFLDGTLKKVRDELNHRIREFHLEYNKEMPRRKWTAIDRKSLELMVELIDKQMLENYNSRKYKYHLSTNFQEEEEREMFIVEERAKFLYDTIAAQRRFLAQQRVVAIRSRPPTRTQL
ncbi:hypothetical protein Tco_0129944 [Tanacetum coccineum]